MPPKTKFDPTRPVDFTTVAGKTAIITGGASGIGLGFATALATHGAQVFILDINDAGGREAETQLRAKNSQATFIDTDFTSWESQLEAFKQILEQSQNGRIDIVITSAGVASPNIKLAWLPEEGEDLPTEPSKPPTPAISANLLGTYYTTHLALSSFVRQQQRQSSPSRPQLLLIAGLPAYFGQDFNPDYTASNHGMRGIFKSLRQPDVARKFGDYRINLLAPAFVATPMLAGVEEMLVWRGARVGEVGSVVEAGMRCVCGEGGGGRAVCVGGAEEGSGGAFDVGDDVEGGNGVRIVERLEEGVFGKMYGNAT
ncbi:hypothetical protein M409DRAFT_25112 [Zasmidium cellare ATCC 36951]|uniref:NAD(P)-binding protein n=1 Tax=Zasmidium cellare ATCC 36951 TaxID=1080233 RepID=A0A6A6CGC4_ZASCE|nr:uncharacterized protein M409DRAFT_25112 [Zasmidium cellare ATCC 36951]KAF2164719.1 hypothetical protein M409DRAFT_25112 [Zasmidium cellare ATCC 36951]